MVVYDCDPAAFRSREYVDCQRNQWRFHFADADVEPEQRSHFVWRLLRHIVFADAHRDNSGQQLRAWNACSGDLVLLESGRHQRVGIDLVRNVVVRDCNAAARSRKYIDHHRRRRRFRPDVEPEQRSHFVRRLLWRLALATACRDNGGQQLRSWTACAGDLVLLENRRNQWDWINFVGDMVIYDGDPAALRAG